MTKYIVEFKWQNGQVDWRGVEATNKKEAERIFRSGGSWLGSYKDVEIVKIYVR